MGNGTPYKPVLYRYYNTVQFNDTDKPFRITDFEHPNYGWRPGNLW